MFTFTYLSADARTDDRANATGVSLSFDGRHVMTLVHATHPWYRVKGYTLAPHPSDPNSRYRKGYNPDVLIDGYLDMRHQNAMWIDPAANQPDDITRDPGQWKTLDDLVSVLTPLMKR